MSAIYELAVSRDLEISRGVMKNEMQTAMSSAAAAPKHRDIFSERYYGFNKRLLCATGLWPDQPFKQKYFRAVGLLITSFIVMIGQVRAMLGEWGQFNFFVQSALHIGINFLGILKLTNGIAHTQEMKKLFDQIQQFWEDTRCLPQINILEKCGEKGRRWTLFYVVLIYVIVSCWIVIAFSPRIMDAVAPLNYSRRRFDPIPMDLMIDPDVYFYPIVTFTSLGILYQVLVTAAMDTVYMVLAQHVCAMFEILRYVNSIQSTCEWKLFAVVGMNMLALSLTGYMVIVTRDNGVAMDTVRYAFLSIAQVVHLFCNTLPGHWIMDSSSCIPHSAYSCTWYTMSLRSRKLILFLIRASIEPCNIIAGKLYVMSVENFSAVLRASMTYFTMLNSMQ